MRRPIDGIRERKIERITGAYQAFISDGFPTTLNGNAETLQVATDTDRTNWLTIYGICTEAVAAGLGDVALTAPIETTSGAEYTPTFSECLWMLGEMRAWAIAADANWRRLVKLAKAATTRDELDAIDVSAGYP